MLAITTCPTCNSRRIRAVTRTLDREYRGVEYSVPKVRFHECPDCGEKLYDREAMQKIESYRPRFAKPIARRKTI